MPTLNTSIPATGRTSLSQTSNLFGSDSVYKTDFTSEMLCSACPGTLLVRAKLQLVVSDSRTEIVPSFLLSRNQGVFPSLVSGAIQSTVSLIFRSYSYRMVQ